MFVFSLYTAILTLIENKIHRIPVIDPLTHNFLFLITHKRILRFLYLYVCSSNLISFYFILLFFFN